MDNVQKHNNCINVSSSQHFRHFPDDEAVEREVTAWFQQQPKEFYAAGFQGLVPQCTGRVR
jgi:hypothetical protein